MRWLFFASLMFLTVVAVMAAAAIAVPVLDLTQGGLVPLGLAMLVALAVGIVLVVLCTPSCRRLPAWAIVGLAAGIVAGTMPAFAQDTTVAVGGWFDIFQPYLTEFASILAAAALGWLLMKLKQLFGLTIEARHREALQSALTNGVNRGISALETAAQDTKVDMRSVVVAEGIRYVERSVPDAVKFFRLDPEHLGDLLEAHLADQVV